MKYEAPDAEKKSKPPIARIAIRFFRHSIKEKDPQKSDDFIRLTKEGGLRAAGEASGEGIDQSVAFGSSRERTQETALKVMAGKEEGVTGEEALEELLARVDEGRGHGSKLGIEDRLNFDLDETTQLGQELEKAFQEKRYLKFIVEESDARAEGLHDVKNSTYSRQAKQVAEIVEKYLHILPRWKELVNDPAKDYEETLRRFMATHLGVAESFLAKVIESTKGIAERDKFVAVLNGQGFDYVEGFKLEIVDGEKPTLHIGYRKEKEGKIVFEFDQDIPPEVIEDIANGSSRE